MTARYPTARTPREANTAAVAAHRARRRAARPVVAWPPAAWRDAVVEPPGRGTPKRWSLRGSGG